MVIGQVMRAAAVTAAVAATAATAVLVAHKPDHADKAGIATLSPSGSASVYQLPSTASSTPSIKTTTGLRKPSPKPTASGSAPVGTTGRPVAAPPKPVPAGLPLSGATGNATQVITVAAPGWGATRATLQTWNKHGSGWTPVGSAVSAWLGYACMSTNAHEGFNGTPVGSFGLTQAFGNYGDPGTRMPYFQATANDWWSGDSTTTS